MNRHSFLKTLALASSMLALVALSARPADANCSVRFAYTANNGQTQTRTVTLEVAERADVHQGNIQYIRNRGDNPVRVQRTGPLGGDVDLAPDGRDPIAGTFAVQVLLQTIVCMPPVEASGPSVEQLVQQAFAAVRGRTLPVLNQLRTWKRDADRWGRQTAEDWGSCPSPGAQQSYDQLGAWRTNVAAAIGTANQVLQEAQAANQSCKDVTGNDALCNLTFNELPVHGWITSLTATEASLQASRTAMRQLQCVDGCRRTASLPVPTAQIEPGGFYTFRNPGILRAEVCTRMDMGEIGYNLSAIASANLAAIVEVEAPSCARSETLSICTNWDMDGLLAQLQRLRLVPPGVGSINVSIPNRTLETVSGVRQARCRRPLQVCVPDGELTISANPLEGLFLETDGQCNGRLEVTCQDPPFGLEPVMRRDEVPDLTQAEVTWTGRRPGRIIVDLTRPDFQRLCLGGGRTALRIPRPPRISMGRTRLDLPFLCTQPNLRDVIANP
ncbi:MAG: hypothetical protein AAF170_09045 [Bacteroidota bacterium]